MDDSFRAVAPERPSKYEPYRRQPQKGAPAEHTVRPLENVEKRVIGALFPEILKELRKNEPFLCSPNAAFALVREGEEAPVMRQVARLRGSETQMFLNVRDEDGNVVKCEVEYVFQIVVHQQSTE